MRKEPSTNPEDYQDLPQPVSAMRKSFADGYIIPDHAHKRDQFLFAVKGIMRLGTDKGTWIVPPEGAAYIPGGQVHSVSMYGAVDMRTLYINRHLVRSDVKFPLPEQLHVVSVSGLLRALILGLCEEPVRYEAHSRGDYLSRLIISEISLAEQLMVHVPLPQDPRLQILCAELLGSPSDDRTLEEWSKICGASSRTLSRLFERELGMNFVQWRQRVRFQNAYEALLQGARVQQVAYENGYNNASAFTAAFTRMMGIAPSAVGAEP